MTLSLSIIVLPSSRTSRPRQPMPRSTPATSARGRHRLLLMMQLMHSRHCVTCLSKAPVRFRKLCYAPELSSSMQLLLQSRMPSFRNPKHSNRPVPKHRKTVGKLSSSQQHRQQCRYRLHRPWTAI